MPHKRQPTTDSRRPTTFAIGCFVFAVSIALIACTKRNPDYGKHSDAAENNYLGNLSVSPGSLAPAFDSGTKSYSVDVASTVTSIAVTAMPQDSHAIMTLNGQQTSSGQLSTISLDGAGLSTPIVIVVTAASGSQNTYMVTVNRTAVGGDNTLQSLSVSPGALAPAFDSSRTSYSVDVAGSTGTVAVTATLQDSNATMTVNGQPTSSGQQRTISLNGPGTSTQISIVVTAANSSQNTYVVTVNRAALSGNNKLQSLTVSPGSLTPPFSPSVAFYTVNAATDTASVTVTVQSQDSGATVTINGQATTSSVVPLSGPGTTTSITVKVTAPNGDDKIYTINVHRAA